MQENKGISIYDAFKALDDIDDEFVAQEVKVIKKNQKLKESLKEETIKLDISGRNMYDKGQAYFYARTGDRVDINGTKFEIAQDDEHKIGYSDEILLKNLETGETTLIAKKDFIKDAQLLKEECEDCKEEKVCEKCGKNPCECVEESCEVKEEDNKIDEAPISTLEPEFDSRKSFYKKAIVDERPDGTKILYSYETPVAMIKNGEVTLGKMTNRGYPFAVWNYSQTTLRHVKEFLKQNGFKADSTKQMTQDYKCDFIRESLSEDLKLDLTTNNKEELVEKGREALEKQEDEPELQVVDVDANTVDDLKDDYVGDIILKCHKCGFVFFKDKEDLIKDEKTGLYNIEEPCNHCGAEEGFELAGQVATASVDAEKADEQDLTKDAPKEEEEKVEVETKEETPEEEVETKKTTVIATESLENKNLFEKLENFDEKSFDVLVNKYFNKIYENVESYTTTNCKYENSSILVEGTIKFKSGKEKETTFKLSEDKQNKVTIRFDCVNETLASQDKAFSLVGKIKDNTLMCESFSCNYKVKKLEEELLVRERFSLKEKKEREVKEEVK